MGDNLTVSIWRGDASGGGFTDFDVPKHESQTVLDVVSWVQQNAEPTLAYRFACRVGMCGSCAMMVNGTPRWTCRTHVDKVARHGRLKIAPLRNLPVIRDLATDMAEFFDKWARVGGFDASKTRTDAVVEISPDDPVRVTASAGIECINCAVCYAACDTVAGNPDYLGPAALNRAWTLVNDAKHDGSAATLVTVAASDGCYNCHSMGSCTAHCPNELDPLASIAGLKRAALGAGNA